MTGLEHAPSPEAKKEQWVGELTGFLAESYQHGWAAGAEKVKDPTTGEKKLVYERDNWRHEDTYTGYFTAPGESKVFYKGKHVWSMNYAGEGQNPEHYDEVQQTFEFLKEALQAFDEQLPLRGPEVYQDEKGEWQYTFAIEGDITNGLWKEEIDRLDPNFADVDLYFSQTGTCGVIIDKDADYNPVYPWDL